MSGTIDNFYMTYTSKRPYDFTENSYYGFPQGGNDRGEYSDIAAHLPFLYFLAKRVESIVEIGVRDCCSTTAFLKGDVKLWSIDLNKSPTVELFESLKLPNWTFIQGDSVQACLDKLTPDSFDVLFIDGLHTYGQVKKELDTYKNSVKKFIVLHDSAMNSQGLMSRDIPGEDGILKAVVEFLRENPQWEESYSVEFNHGLIVLENVNG